MDWDILYKLCGAANNLSSLVRYDDSSLAAIRHVQSIIPVVRQSPNIRSHSVLLNTLREVPFFLRDSRANETRACVKVTPREKGRETRLAFNEITHQRHTLLLLRELTRPVQV